MRQASKEPIRVLQIGMHDQRGGIENLLMNYYRAIDKSKVQFDFVVPYKNGSYYDKEIEEMGGKVYKLSFKNDKNIFKFIKELKKIYKNGNYSIVHCSDTGLGLIYLYLAKVAGVKVRIAHSHSDKMEPSAKGIIKKRLAKLYVKQANVFFACSENAGKFLFGGKQFIVINNAIDLLKYRFNEERRKETRKQLEVKKDEILIGNIGRLDLQKNQQYLIKILNDLDNKYKLLIIGSGPLKTNLTEEAQRLGVAERLIMIDGTDDIPRYLDAMDVFVLPSIFEGLPVVAVEAQAAGLSIITSNKVTKSIKYTNSKIIHLSLEDNLEEWTKAIISSKRNNNLIYENLLFDIKKQADVLVNHYLKLGTI